jgi:hypothetical protein
MAAATAATQTHGPRGVEKLEPLQDHHILQADQAYLVRRCAPLPTATPCSGAGRTRRAHPTPSCVRLRPQVKHSLDKLLGGLMTDILKQKPADPLQFIIDTLTLSPEQAAQVCAAVVCQLTLQHTRAAAHTVR